jgi:DNA-binding response OmpR family regulator
MTMASLLVVDDERDVLQGLRLLLERAGHEVRVAGDGRAGLRAFFERPAELVVLDVSMPELDGWQALERLRTVSDVPVLMLTARGHEEERVRGLRDGADDYLTKPFSRPELTARVDALLRRARRGAGPSAAPQVYVDELLTVDFARHEARLVGEPIALTPLEFRLLGAFVQNAGLVLEHEQLIGLAWEEPQASDRSHLKSCVRLLRRKLGWDRPDGPLESVRGVGYRYRAP